VVTVQAFARLHFGLMNPNGGESDRIFGGVGLIISDPNLLVQVEPSASWAAEGPLSDRALTFAQRFWESSRREDNLSNLPPQRISIKRAIPRHIGLGSGTQLALATARALAVSWNLPCDTPTLARRVGRGARSALGIHGFDLGGLLVEGGKRSAASLSPLLARHTFPEEWRLVLTVPGGSEGAEGLSGRDEIEAFARLQEGEATQSRTEKLCQLVLFGMLPALLERDLEMFGEALHEFNALAGEAFAPVQGGIYASRQVAETVAYLRGLNHRGVGQSSWGPLVFAITGDQDQAEWTAARLRRHFALAESQVWLSCACNHGHRILQHSGESAM
jgi:beta-ribofuranosylaminobenzene 5'-phosphate synthase